MSYDVWTHDGRKPELVTRCEDKASARQVLARSRHGAIAINGVMLEVRESCGLPQSRAMREAIGDAWAAAGGTPPEPLFVGPTPEHKVRPLEFVTRKLVANNAAPKPAKPTAVRPPMPRRQTAPAVDELAPLRHRIAQLTSQVAELERERDEARCLADEALTEGLRASQRASAAPVVVPATVLLDELQLTRIATRAAREAVKVTREDARLRALAERCGGVEALESCVAGTERLLRGLA